MVNSMFQHQAITVPMLRCRVAARLSGFFSKPDMLATTRRRSYSSCAEEAAKEEVGMVPRMLNEEVYSKGVKVGIEIATGGHARKEAIRVEQLGGGPGAGYSSRRLCCTMGCMHSFKLLRYCLSCSGLGLACSPRLFADWFF